MNVIQLSGRLPKNPEIIQYRKENGTFGLKATYTLAVDRDWRRTPSGVMHVPGAVSG